jgi:acetylornithine deacetylase/succinyl-diaminopimelate desuccinylase-like protein
MLRPLTNPITMAIPVKKEAPVATEERASVFGVFSATNVKHIAGGLLMFFFISAAHGLTPDEQSMLDWIDAHQDEAIKLLEETVNIGSGTMNHAGVRAVGDAMASSMEDLGMAIEWIDMPPTVNRAGHLVARKDGIGAKFLLIGHLDTVFEADDTFQAFTREGNVATGPGISDMKSGNVVLVYALKALAAAGALEDVPVAVVFTGDEEKPGKPLDVARKDLIDAGKWADIALGFEGAITTEDTDWATIARRSSSSWILETTGTQAHSSAIFSERVGAGAINEAARILSRFYEDVRGDYGLTFNAGTIQGGTTVTYDSAQNRGSTFGKTNVVPSTATVHGGIRALTPEQLAPAKRPCWKLSLTICPTQQPPSPSKTATRRWRPPRVIAHSPLHCLRSTRIWARPHENLGSPAARRGGYRLCRALHRCAGRIGGTGRRRSHPSRKSGTRFYGLGHQAGGVTDLSPSPRDRHQARRLNALITQGGCTD